ncbi:SDR family oxidoreductase [Cyanobium sp. HWJ4-Hawea]|uniref:SDR family oxidoreductase n=1 Tax=unclassified Cyanobium TaxID=2627006 RepID=UPI0020CF6B88|nr:MULTISPECIES: SDR family oxidoreductase [unclassified Cyanobium]MCP9774456.1 SDR family oxidoreductase [Cyanobium sp. WAJ14-Wanaka]MCP9808430.1 SDR family oxidoreductase [Cyanobium sp. HWJ4-Hawea]
MQSPAASPVPGSTLAVSGASGKTGWRVVQEALERGYRVKALVRPGSELPAGLEGAEVVRLELHQSQALEAALRGCDGLVIATGARPSVDLLGPLKVDAFGVADQIRACRAVGLKRVVLVSSLCAGRWLHPLNLFGLILVWKRLGESWLEQSGINWTVIRPGGLKESEAELEKEGVVFSGADQQESDSIPRRLVARVCLDALETQAAIGQIVEITSRPDPAAPNLQQWLAAQVPG